MGVRIIELDQGAIVRDGVNTRVDPSAGGVSEVQRLTDE